MKTSMGTHVSSICESCLEPTLRIFKDYGDGVVKLHCKNCGVSTTVDTLWEQAAFDFDDQTLRKCWLQDIAVDLYLFAEAGNTHTLELYNREIFRLPSWVVGEWREYLLKEVVFLKERRKAAKNVEAFVSYYGDIDLRYGGTFVDLSTWDDGFVEYLEVMDLASSVGYDWAVLVVNDVVEIDNGEAVTASLKTWGQDWQELARTPPMTRRLIIASCLVQYYGTPMYPLRKEVIQTIPHGDMVHHGMEADYRLESGEELFDYLLRRGYLTNYK